MEIDKRSRKSQNMKSSKKSAKSKVQAIESAGITETIREIDCLKDRIENIPKYIQTVAARRDEGDGESVAEVPLEDAHLKKIYSNHPDSRDRPQKRFNVNLELDVVSLVLFLCGLATRIYRLEEPRSIVFDELHYGKYVSMYLKQTFFFDSHPPLGKQLIAAVAYLAGFDGQFKFDRIGSSYPDTVPLFALRLVPAICGSLVVPTAYHLMLELGLRQSTAVLAAFLLLCDNAMLTQSRFILMESMLLWFALFGLLCILKFRQYHTNPFCVQWWGWLTLGAASLTCALCVKYVGLFTCFLALFLVGRDYWRLLADRRLSNCTALAHLLVRILVLVGIPTAVYLSIFYVHLTVLNRAGPHDSVMTSAFQASLEVVVE